MAAHILGRRRHAATGRFGLRALPGGFGTPMFGDEVVRVSGRRLLHERGSEVFVADLATASLRDLAQLVGVDLEAPFEVGHDTPDLGDVDEPLAADATAIGDWFGRGAAALDRIARAGSTTAQLWPEHFDLALSSGRSNLGASAGDDLCPTPYVYVGPWDADRPGDASFWNVPFGALRTGDLSVEEMAAFFADGLARF